MEERRQEVRRESDYVELEIQLIKRDLQSLKKSVDQDSEQRQELIDSIKKLQDRLNHHYETEHREIKELVSWAKGSAIAVKIIGIIVAIMAGVASAWAWITGHFTITPK